MKAILALLRLNWRVIAVRYWVFIALSLLTTLPLLSPQGWESRIAFVDLQILALSFLMSWTILSSTLMLGFSPIEELALTARNYGSALPITAIQISIATELSVKLPAISLVVLLGMTTVAIWLATGIKIAIIEALLLPLLRGGVLVSDVVLLGFCFRLLFGNKSWLRNGGYIVGVSVSLGIIASKVPGTSYLIRRFLDNLLSTGITFLDMVILAFTVSVWLILVRSARRVFGPE